MGKRFSKIKTLSHLSYHKNNSLKRVIKKEQFVVVCHSLSFVKKTIVIVKKCDIIHLSRFIFMKKEVGIIRGVRAWQAWEELCNTESLVSRITDNCIVKIDNEVKAYELWLLLFFDQYHLGSYQSIYVNIMWTMESRSENLGFIFYIKEIYKTTFLMIVI